MAYARDDDRRRDRNARTRVRLHGRDVDHAIGSSMRGDENDEDVDRRDPDKAAMIGDCLHESRQGRYGGVAPYSKHSNERTYWPGYDKEHGPHRGKGPKGDTRSDERIKEHVCEVLLEDSHVDASEIDVQVKNGEATLNGTVDHRSTKRRVEDLVEGISGGQSRSKQPARQAAGLTRIAGGNGYWIERLLVARNLIVILRCAQDDRKAR